MLTKLTVRNFKRFGDVEIELGSPVLFIGPNNSGKTTAMQALALWDIGLRRWNEKRGGRSAPEQRPGVTVNRRDLFAIPVPDAKALWRQLHIRDVRVENERPRTSNIRIEIIVEGEAGGRAWECGLEFDYANEESFYCRPLRLADGKSPERMAIPDDAGKTQIALLPPMSGLAATEIRLDPGAIDVRIGEGRTAEVLRNLCHTVYEQRPAEWPRLVAQIERLFGVRLDAPRYIAERGEIIMTYTEQQTTLDLSAAGRGLQQTLLLLAYMYVHPGAVLLLDEPDAHLEILRQRQVYDLITSVANENNTQVIAASHSEVLLNEAAESDTVIAFVGKPHSLGNRRAQVRRALNEIGWEQYYQAEQNHWVLYLEGSTDLSILKRFAKRLGHEDASRALDRAFVHYVGNSKSAIQRHFFGLREAVKDLRGVALLDQMATGDFDLDPIESLMWTRREIENYFCTEGTLVSFARVTAEAEANPDEPLFLRPKVEARVSSMRAAIERVEGALTTLGRGSLWSPDVKASDEVLDPVFRTYYEMLGLYNTMAKKNFHVLVDYIPDAEIDPEISSKLDTIAHVAESAQPPEL